jgi:hypothetical protein
MAKRADDKRLQTKTFAGVEKKQTQIREISARGDWPEAVSLTFMRKTVALAAAAC